MVAPIVVLDACLLSKKRQDDQHEGHQLRDERQTVEKFPYHDEDNVTRPALQFNACLAIGLLQATWNPSSVASRMRERGPAWESSPPVYGMGFL